MTYANFLTQTADIARGTITPNAEGDPREQWTIVAENVHCCLQIEESSESDNKLKEKEKKKARIFIHDTKETIQAGDILCVYQEDDSTETWRITEMKRTKAFGKTIMEGFAVCL